MNYFNHFTFSAYLTTASMIIIGTFLLLQGRWKKIIYLTFGLYSFSVALWSFCVTRFAPTFQDTSLVWGRLLHLGAIFIPTLFIHFVLEFLGQKKRKIIIPVYLIAATFLAFNFFTRQLISGTTNKIAYSYPTPGIIYPFYFAFFVASVVFCLIRLFQELLTASGNRKNQIKYLFWASLVGYTGGLKNFLVVFNLEPFPIYPYGTYVIPIYVLAVAYAIITYRLMGIEVLLKRGFWLISSFVMSLAAGYGLFTLSDATFKLPPQASAGIASMGMLLSFGFLLWRLYETQFKPADLKLKALKESSLEMVVFPDPVRLSREICGRVFSAFEPMYAHIYLVGKQKQRYDLQHMLGESTNLKKRLGKKDPVVKWFIENAPTLRKKGFITDKERNILFYHDVTERWLADSDFLGGGDNVKENLLEVKQQMEDLGANLVIASSYKRKLYGLLILGEKKSGFYAPEDLEVLSSLSTIAAMNIRNALAISDLHVKVRDKTRLLKEMHDRTVQMVFAFNKAIDARDAYTADHSIEVKEIGTWIAQEMGIDMTEELSFALQLHDLGKIGIPDSILNKEGKLTDVERKKIQEHPKIGYDILGIMDFFKRVGEITYCHQERFDGKGYPRALKGDEIPLEARIIAVADAYHAMTSDRPYRDKMPMADVARELLKGRGKHFDPHVIDALTRKLVKTRSLTKRQLKHIAAEEGLVAFGDVNAFLEKILQGPSKK